MPLVDVDWSPSDRKLRQFAGLWLLLFAALSARSVWHGAWVGAGIFGGLSAIGLGGAAWPALIRPVYKTAMAVSLPIGWVTSHVLIATLFYVVVAPIGLVMRVFGYDPLARRLDRSRKSYWTPRDRPRDLSRYFKQF